MDTGWEQGSYHFPRAQRRKRPRGLEDSTQPALEEQGTTEAWREPGDTDGPPLESTELWPQAPAHLYVFEPMLEIQANQPGCLMALGAVHMRGEWGLKFSCALRLRAASF